MLARDLPAVLDALAAELDAAGVPSSVDPTQVPVPGAWVTVGTLTPDRMCGDFTATGQIYLVARDTGHTTAVSELAAMLSAVAHTFPAIGTVTPDTVALPGLPGPLPAFLIPIEIGD